jgi:Fur family peroxide stress response transcriptional regulator
MQNMPDPKVRFDEVIVALKGRDFRMTPQRIELVRLVASSEGHPSAAQIYARMKRRFPTVSQATVYKTLALLKDMGQVLEIDLHEGRHYDGNRPQPHPHLVCVKCNKIVDAEVSLDKDSTRTLEELSGYTILRHQISLFGLCSDCKKEG